MTLTKYDIVYEDSYHCVYKNGRLVTRKTSLDLAREWIREDKRLK